MTADAAIGRRGLKRGKKRSLLIEAGIIGAIAILLIFIIPALISPFRLNLLGRFLSLAIVALGIDLIWGYTGLLSLGHGIFFGLGGYAIGMHLKLQVPQGELPDFMGLYGVTELPWFWHPFQAFPFASAAVVLIPGILAALLGYLVFRNRIRGVYFSILTQAATIVFFSFFNGQQKLFNGTSGLVNFKTLLGTAVGSRPSRFTFYVLTVLLLIATYALCRWLTSGRFGRLLVAIRDDESRVRFSGYDPTEFKVLVFAISGAIAGLAGAMYTLQSGSVSPRAMDVAFSIEMVIWVAIGGRGSLVGAVVGALLVNYARSFFSEQFAEIWLFFQGALFLIVVTVLPDGIVGWLRSSDLLQLGHRRQLSTYPEIEVNPEVQSERQEIETRSEE